MADRTKLASVLLWNCLQFFLTYLMQSSDKWQNLKFCSISKGPRTTGHLSIPEVDIGSVRENVTCSLYSRAPCQERATDTETGTESLFNDARDRRQKQGVPDLQRGRNLSQCGGFKRQSPGDSSTRPDRTTIRWFYFLIVSSWKSLLRSVYSWRKCIYE